MPTAGEHKTVQARIRDRQNFNDKDVDNLIEHFRDKSRRKEFFKEYNEIEMLYEIISPDAFLRPFIADYATLSSIYEVVRNAYAKRVYVDRAFQKKTNELVQRRIGSGTRFPNYPTGSAAKMNYANCENRSPSRSSPRKTTWRKSQPRSRRSSPS